MTAPEADAPPLAEQDLCTGCAACCDGTMFTYVEVTRDEEQTLADRFAMEAREVDAIFYQPCPHSVGQRCQIYEVRPETCRKFRCKTLKAFHAKEIDSAEAFRRVNEMLEGRTALRALLAEGETLDDARRRRKQIAEKSDRTAAEMAFLLKLTAFDLLLDRYFRNPGKGMFCVTPPPATGKNTQP